MQRKGKTVTPKLFLVKAVRDCLDDYLDDERGRESGPLFQTRTGTRFSIQQVDYLLKQTASLDERGFYRDCFPAAVRPIASTKVMIRGR